MNKIMNLLNKYLLEEPDQALRAQLEKLQPGPELDDRMANFRFGTAGLRGRMEAGYNRMNIPSVYRLAYAVGDLSADQAIFVIGYDARNNSRLFADEVSRVLASLDYQVYLFSEPVATPLCAFGTKYLNASMGIMITASHNPAYDNGIKLFDHRGAQAHGQILRDIELKMTTAPIRPDFYNKYQKEKAKKLISQEIFEAYYQATKITRLFDPDELNKNINILYTALHGVGQKFFWQMAHNEGFDNLGFVSEQATPDGNFKTLEFPNPEEEHTLDIAHEQALTKKFEWVFANDPDADRLQVSCLKNNQFVKLSGNEMGSILGFFAINRALKQQEKPIVASSIVSSRMLETIAQDLGAIYVDAQTGFSNIINKALLEQEKTSNKFVFAYEEAIGFLIGDVVLDKDGINAATRFLEIAAWLKKNNLSVWELLDQLYERFGLFMSTQWSVRYNGTQAVDIMNALMTRVRNLDSNNLAKLFKFDNLFKYDLNNKQENNYKNIRANVIIFEKPDLFRLIVRPSGTEPKIKYYLELINKDKDMNLSTKKTQLADKMLELRLVIENILS